MSVAPRASTPSARVVAACLAGAMLTGVLGALQSRMNGQLAVSTGVGIEAALWSFGSGLVCLLVGMLIRPAARRAFVETIDAIRAGHLRWYMLLAGALGGVLVGVQSNVVPLMGVALFTVALVAGQAIGGLLVDALGISPGGAKAVTWVRGWASAASLVGVVLAVGAAGTTNLPWAGVAVTLVAGIGTALQTAWNSRQTAFHGQPVASTTYNFLAGTLFLLALLAVMALTGQVHPRPLQGEWWVWWGGVAGAIFVAISTVVVPRIGVLLFTLGNLVAQLLTALILDVLNPSGPGTVNAMRIVGLAITAASAMLAGWAAARGSRAQS